MKDACLDNVITCDLAAIDFVHVVAIDPTTTSDSTVATSACTQAVDGSDSSAYCSFTSTLEVWDEDTDDWLTYTTAATATYPWIQTSDFDADNRVMSVTTTSSGDATTYEEPITYNLRWKAEDSTSEMDEAIVYDYFDVKIQYGCVADTVTLTNSGAGRDT